MDAKMAGDLVYILGETKDELGASEYYEHLGHIGLKVPTLQTEVSIACYRTLYQAIEQELIASCHGVYRGGLGVHLALVAMAGDLGMTVDLAKVPGGGMERDDTVLFSESPGRFIVTIAPSDRSAFESIMGAAPCSCVGVVSDGKDLIINGLEGNNAIRLPIAQLKAAWKGTFKDLI
jgi:phosphoribosylformylglycinamidine synthase